MHLQCDCIVVQWLFVAGLVRHTLQGVLYLPHSKSASVCKSFILSRKGYKTSMTIGASCFFLLVVQQNPIIPGELNGRCKTVASFGTSLAHFCSKQLSNEKKYKQQY